MKESLLLLRNYNKASCIVGFGPSFAASTPQGRSQPRVAAAVVSRPAMPTVFIDLADVKNNHLIRGRSLEAVQSQNASFARLRHPRMCGRVRCESRKVAISPTSDIGPPSSNNRLYRRSDTAVPSKQAHSQWERRTPCPFASDICCRRGSASWQDNRRRRRCWN